jgi:hypothetical protein
MELNRETSPERFAPLGKIGIEDYEELYRAFLPYIIRQEKDGTYLLLNRHFKPVGMVPRPGDWVDYATSTQRFRVRGLTPEIAAKISVKGDPDTGWIVLYHDGCRPQDSDKHRRALLRRVKLFFDLVEVENLGTTRAVADEYVHSA